MEWRAVTVDPDLLWEPIVTHGLQWCAPNAHADVRWLQVGDRRWRVAVTRPVSRNSYVVSATGQYLDYAQDEIHRLKSRLGRVASRVTMGALSPMLRALDPIVVLDALPVSTVLHEKRTESEWKAALDAARAEYPSLPIVIRSLDTVESSRELTMLQSFGLSRIVSRLVFHQDPRRECFWQIRNVQHDLRLERNAPMRWRALEPCDTTAIARLYWQLYGEKHSTMNPQFTSDWLAHGVSCGVLWGEGAEIDGRLVAAFLAYRVADVMTNPVFGYDTSLPQALGLYRRLSLRTMEVARDRELRIHASSGAPGFKASRGGEPALEYHAVDLRGVAGMQGTAWRVQIALANKIGPALLHNAT
jgi:Acetyltransferase (GNAT) domain